MSGLFPLILLSLLAIGIGIWQLTAPLEVLWLRQERFLLSRGLSPQRNPAWEESVRGRGWVCITIGVILLILYGVIMSSYSPPMSGVIIDGHALTQAEWDACGHDTPRCMTQIMTRHPK